MGRLEDLRINAYLSEVARGYRNNAFVADVLFPTIYSEKEKIDIFQFNKEAFNIYDTERAIRANSNVISPQGFSKHTATLTEHDLSYPIDYREEQEAEKVKLQFDMIAVERLNGINNREGVENRNKMFKELLIANYPIKELYERQAD